MAFNNLGKYWLAAGQSMWVELDFKGADRGAQYLMASPLPFDTFPTPSGITSLECSRVGKQFVYFNGGTRWTYYCLVQCNGGSGHNSTWFTMQGGGNI